MRAFVCFDRMLEKNVGQTEVIAEKPTGTVKRYASFGTRRYAPQMFRKSKIIKYPSTCYAKVLQQNHLK